MATTLTHRQAGRAPRSLRRAASCMSAKHLQAYFEARRLLRRLTKSERPCIPPDVRLQGLPRSGASPARAGP